MKKGAAAVLLLSPFALSACSQGEARKTSNATSAVTPAAEVIGKPLDCLPITQFSNTRIRDDQTIDFMSGAGGRVWRVTLPNKCNGLRSANTFTYETSLTQLCRQDIIYPLQQLGNQWQRMGGCGMGPFVPVKLAK